MGTTAEKLTYLNETKTQLKDMLNLGGASLTTEPFRQYVDTLKNRYLYFMNNGIQQVWDNWEKVNGTGETLTLNNTEEAPMSLVYKGNTSQEGTPTPETPQEVHVVTGDNDIKVEGKNLFDSTKLNHLAFASVGSNNVLSQAVNYIGYAIPCNEGEVYSISRLATTNTRFRVMFSSETPAQNVAIFGGTGNVSTYDNALKIENIVVPSGAKYLNIYLSNASETLPPILLEKNSTATTYEPYQSQSYAVNLGSMELCKIGDYQDSIKKSTGKNLFDKDNPTIPNADMSYGQIISKNDTNCWFFEVDTNKTYTLTKQSYNYGYIGYSNTKPVIGTNLSNRSSIANETTITINPTDKYLCIFISKSDNLDIIQLEKGSTSTAYEPYGKVWYLNKQIGKVVLNGSESWYLSSSGSDWYEYGCSNIIVNGKSGYNNCLTNYFSKLTNNRCLNNGTSCLIRTPDTTITIVEQWKTWLSTHNTTVYYALQTPTYTEIEDSTLLSQLNALAKSYASQTNISQESNDLPFIINATALREMS